MKTNLILFAVLVAAIAGVVTMSTATMVAYGGWGLGALGVPTSGGSSGTSTRGTTELTATTWSLLTW